MCIVLCFYSHQPANVFLTVPLNAMHLILVLLVGCTQVCCFGFICLLSSYKSLFSLLSRDLLLLDLKEDKHTRLLHMPSYQMAKTVILINSQMFLIDTVYLEGLLWKNSFAEFLSTTLPLFQQQNY